MNHLVCAMLLIAGVVHLLPLSGVVGSAQLATLYGLDFTEPNLAILMRHRAVLFGLIGSFMLYAAFKPALRLPAILGGTISVASFLILAASVEGYNAQIGRVFVIDIAVLVCLVIAAVAQFAMSRRAGSGVSP